MSMLSTRGAAAVSESMAILRGLAPDGGLYVPEDFPHFSMEEIAALGALDYQARALAILQKFLPDFTADELKNAIAGAYGTGFDDADIAPVRPVGDWAHALELWHGPTLAFKDMALQLLPHLLTLSAKKNGETREIFILVATSGDTGKAALEGFLDVPGTRCCVFYPREGVSQAQRLQMVTTGGANTHVIAVNGNFDDAQTGVKRIFADRAFAETMAAQGRVLSSANSINIGRLVPQVVYYVYAYAKLLANGEIEKDEKVNVVVPTGNFGNILAAYFAKQMGVPFGKLICASNDNKVLYDFFRTGTYDKNREFILTTSPSMDILVSSNLERLLYLSCGRDAAKTKAMMEQLSTNGKYEITGEFLEWAEENYHMLKNSKMIGGKPDITKLSNGDLSDQTQAEAYGFSCFDGTDGIISLRNPSANADKTIKFTFDRTMGVAEGAGTLNYYLEHSYLLSDKSAQTGTLKYGQE